MDVYGDTRYTPTWQADFKSCVQSLVQSARLKQQVIDQSRYGFIVTAYHVIDGARSNNDITVELAGDRFVPVAVYGASKVADLAVVIVELRQPNQGFRLADYAGTRVGSEVYAIGSQLGLLDESITSGIVSGKRVSSDGVALLQVSAALNRGVSGGPILNAEGDIVAIVSFGLSETNSIGFGIGSSELKRAIVDSKEFKFEATIPGATPVGSNSGNSGEVTAGTSSSPKPVDPLTDSEALSRAFAEIYSRNHRALVDLRLRLFSYGKLSGDMPYRDIQTRQYDLFNLLAPGQLSAYNEPILTMNWGDLGTESERDFSDAFSRYRTAVIQMLYKYTLYAIERNTYHANYRISPRQASRRKAEAAMEDYLSSEELAQTSLDELYNLHMKDEVRFNFDTFQKNCDKGVMLHSFSGLPCYFESLVQRPTVSWSWSDSIDDGSIVTGVGLSRTDLESVSTKAELWEFIYLRVRFGSTYYIRLSKPGSTSKVVSVRRT